MVIVFNNSRIPEVAPTGITGRKVPYFLMLAFGVLLLLVLGGGRVLRKRAARKQEEQDHSCPVRGWKPPPAAPTRGSGPGNR